MLLLAQGWISQMLSPVCRLVSYLFLLETPDLLQYLSTKIFVFNAVGDDDVGDSGCSDSAMVSRQKEIFFSKPFTTP